MNQFIPIAFGPLGGPEMLVIFLVILLLFGAKKLPELAKGIGRASGEFNKAKQEFENEIKQAQNQAEKEWEEPKGKLPASGSMPRTDVESRSGSKV